MILTHPAAAVAAAAVAIAIAIAIAMFKISQESRGRRVVEHTT